MHTIFKAKGTLQILEDAEGEPVTGDWKWPVTAHVKYRLKPSPIQPLIVEIYGYNLVGLGQHVDRLVLENGVTITGCTHGPIGLLRTGEIKRLRMFDVREKSLRLFPDNANQNPSNVDALVFGVVSSRPLGYGLCRNGWARPGRPFSFVEQLPRYRVKGSWSSGALRIHHRSFQITFAPTSEYWRGLVDTQTLHHDSIAGIRKESGGVIAWSEFNELVEMLQAFLGWINHCVSPVFHVKAYRKGRLVYRGYDLNPHPTIQRERYSWLPWHGPEDGMEDHGDMVGHAFDAFSRTWTRNREERGLFHIALQLLRGKEKGGPGSPPSLLYLRDTFAAIGILTTMLVGSNPSRGRHQTILECIKNLNVPDRIPEERGREFLSNNHRELWWAAKQNRVQEDEKRKGTLSRPLANVENWLLHLDDSQNADRLLGLGTPRQTYLVDVSIWLADLMLMRVVEYQGYYFNRLTLQVEPVPWMN